MITPQLNIFPFCLINYNLGAASGDLWGQHKAFGGCSRVSGCTILVLASSVQTQPIMGEEVALQPKASLWPTLSPLGRPHPPVMFPLQEGGAESPLEGSPPPSPLLLNPQADKETCLCQWALFCSGKGIFLPLLGEEKAAFSFYLPHLGLFK